LSDTFRGSLAKLARVTVLELTGDASVFFMEGRSRGLGLRDEQLSLSLIALPTPDRRGVERARLRAPLLKGRKGS